MVAFADEIGDHPVLLALLERFEVEREQLAAAQAAPEEQRKHRMIADRAEGRRAVRVEEPPPLVGGEPVAQAHAKAADAFHPANPGRQLGTEQPSIGGFIGDAAHSGQAKINRRRRVVSLFQVNAVAEDHRAIEGSVARNSTSRRNR